MSDQSGAAEGIANTDGAGWIRRDRVLIVLLGLTTAIGSMTTDIYVPAMPNLQRSFATDPASIQNTLSIFLIGLAVGQLVYGPMSDRYGRRRPLLFGLTLYCFGSLLAAFSPSLWVLLAARFLQAIGASAGVVIARAVVTDRYPTDIAARVHTMLVQVLALTAIAAPLLGAAVISFASWRALFLLLFAICALCLTALVLLLRESHPPNRRTTSLVIAQTAAFRKLLANPPFLMLCLASGATLAAMFALLMGSSFTFVDQYGWSTSEYALLYTATSVGFLITGFANDRALLRHKPGWILAIALPAQSALIVALVALAWWTTPSAQIVALVLILMISNLAFIHGNLVAAALEHTRASAGAGASVLGLFQYGVSSLASVAAAATSSNALMSMSLTTALFTLAALMGFALARPSRSVP